MISAHTAEFSTHNSAQWGASYEDEINKGLCKCTNIKLSFKNQASSQKYTCLSYKL